MQGIRPFTYSETGAHYIQLDTLRQHVIETYLQHTRSDGMVVIILFYILILMMRQKIEL